MRVTILGCGTAGGVPQIGDDWGDCDREEPRNRRLRPSILVEEAGLRILVDTTPDLFERYITHLCNNDFTVVALRDLDRYID